MLIIILLYILFLIVLSIKHFKFVINPFIIEIPVILFIVVPQIVFNLISVYPLDSIASDFLILVYVTGLYVGTILKYPSFKIPEILSSSFNVKLSVLIAIILLLPTFSILRQCGLSFQGIRCYYETVVFSSYASLYALGKMFLTVAIILLFIKKRALGIMGIFLVFILAFSGSKAAIFNLLFLLFLLYETYNNVSYYKLALYSIGGLLFLILYNSFQVRSDATSNAWLSALNYFDLYKNQSFLVEEIRSGRHQLYMGKIYISTFYQFIPRIVWPGKPFDYGFAILNYDFLPEAAAVNYMPSFGIGQYYADFGYIGAFFFGFSTGAFRGWAYRIFYRSKRNNSSFLLYFSGISIITIIMLAIEYLPGKIFKLKKWY